ncbi:integrase, partial [Bifidobacterium hapali]
DSDNGSEFINRDLIAWLHERDIEQTRSRPYRKNDQATVESRNNHVVRRHAFYYRYTADELDLLNELWELVRVKANLFTPSKKPIARESTRDGRPRRVYDRPRTPWERLKEFDDQDRAAGGPGFIPDDKREEIERTLATVNPAELVRRIHDIQDRLEDMAAPRTARLARRSGPDMAYLNKTLARIAGVEPEDNETPPADKD